MDLYHGPAAPTNLAKLQPPQILCQPGRPAPLFRANPPRFLVEYAPILPCADTKYPNVDFPIFEGTICRFGSYFFGSVSGIISMSSRVENSKLITLFQASRPQFLVASVAPILVGSFLGYAIVGSFNWLLFILAMLAIMAIHAGANLANDYFDHLSRNDWVNENPTPFSGGSRCIQQGTLSPKAVLITALIALMVGSALGIVIVLLTGSLFILILGLAGLLGGFFYTAPPLKLGYRYVGEFIIAILFGLLPVFGAYYLQTQAFDAVPLLPGCVVGLLIFLVIFVNEFPDLKADAAVNKRTLVVHFGVPISVWIYRTALLASFLVAAAMMIYSSMFFAGLLYLITLPIAVRAIKSANKEDLATPGQYRASQITVLLHAAGSLALTIGFIITALRSPAA
jgi:1,4-dihydroxy-2-naphthoate octaprenyltransferase